MSKLKVSLEKKFDVYLDIDNITELNSYDLIPLNFTKDIDCLDKLTTFISSRGGKLITMNNHEDEAEFYVRINHSNNWIYTNYIKQFLYLILNLIALSFGIIGLYGSTQKVSKHN